MKLSDQGFKAIQLLNKFHAKPYTDEDGDRAIGFGHKISEGDGVAPYDLINVFKAEELLWRDLDPIIDKINKNVTKNLSQQAFDSLVLYSFVNQLEAACG